MNVKVGIPETGSCHLGELCGVDHEAVTRVDWPIAGQPATLADVPRLIKALDIPSHGVAEQARKTLARLAGRDLGGEAKPWQDWWQGSQPGAGASPS